MLGVRLLPKLLELLDLPAPSNGSCDAAAAPPPPAPVDFRSSGFNRHIRHADANTLRLLGQPADPLHLPGTLVDKMVHGPKLAAIGALGASSAVS